MIKQKKVLEKDVQLDICKYLTEENYFFWRNNNKPVFDFKRGAFRHQPKYTPKGLPDIFVIHCGRVIGLEVKKDKKQKLRPDQETIKIAMREHGGVYKQVCSVQEVKDLMVACNIL
jgi:hypothetical protein